MGESVGTEGVQADVQPVHPRLPQGSGQPGERSAVGGQTEFLNALQSGDSPADVQDPPADQGLAAGEPDLPDSQGCGLPDDLHQLLHRADLIVGTLRHALRRHTVAASEIAQVRDGQAQIGDLPGAGILHNGLLKDKCFA